MAKVVIGYNDRVQYGTVAASSQVPTMEAVNVLNPNINLLWRATVGGTSWLVADLGEPYDIGYIFGAHANLTRTNVVRFRISSADASGVAGDLYDSGTIESKVNIFWQQLVHILPSTVTGRYVRVDLSPSQGPAELGRFAAGPIWRPSYNFSFGSGPYYRGNSRRSKTLSELVFVDERPRSRGIRLKFDAIKEAEAVEDLQSIFMQNGDARDVLVCLDPLSDEISRDSFWGLIEELPELPIRAPRIYNTTFAVMSRI